MKFSIITINYDNVEGLRRTIESVVSQSCHDYEFIVIDGGSSDGSVDVIKEYADRIDYWVSEPDGGIYPAMNKGVKVAKGEYCNFMNSGDVFYSNDVLQEVESKGVYADIVCGDLCYGNHIICSSPDVVTMKYLYRTTMYHQASFIKTAIQKSIPFNERMKVSGDWNFFFDALILHNCSYQHVPVVVAIFEEGGFSSHNMEIAMKEKKDVLSDIFPERILKDYQDYTYGHSNYRFMMNRVFEIPPVKRIIYKISLILLRLMNLKLKSPWIRNLNGNPDATYINYL